MTARKEIAISSADARTRFAIRLAWDRLAAAMTDRELAVVAGFCSIGLLLTAAVVHSFGNFGDLAHSLRLMP
jgi:hypothetical protein